MDYSIIIPTYNSEDYIDNLIADINSVLSKKRYSFEIIAVNDGSSDNTEEKLNKLALEHPKFKGINLKGNFGQMAATICGIHASQGQAIITMDDDGQYPPSEIVKLIEYYRSHSYAIVYGSPAERKHNQVHRSLVLLFKFLFDYLILPSYRKVDFYTTFRIFSRKLFFNTDDQVLPKRHLFVFWEISVDQMSYIYVEHKPRAISQSGYNVYKLMSYYKPQIYYTLQKFFGFLALLCLLICFGYVIGLILNLKLICESESSISNSYFFTLLSITFLIAKGIFRYLLKNLVPLHYKVKSSTSHAV